MRPTIILTLLTLLPWGLSVFGQTFSEWFHQKKTQLDYLRQQIAALQVYRTIAQKGYAIAGNGLDSIGLLKDQDLQLHTRQFNSSYTVNPVVLEDPSVKAIQDLCKATTEKAATLSDPEKFASGIAMVKNTLDNLLADGHWKMTDDQRLTRLGQLYNRIHDIYQVVMLRTPIDEIKKKRKR